MRRVRLLSISTPFKGVVNDVTMLAAGHWMYSGPTPQIGDGTLWGSMLAYNALVSEKPIFSIAPSNALQLLVDVERGIFLKGDQGHGHEVEFHEDPNGILANAATGPARPFIGASGGYEIALHDLTGEEDFSTWTAVGTAVGGYESISGASGNGNYVMRRVTMPLVAGTVAKIEVEAHDVLPGDTVQVEISTDTGGAKATTFTIAAEGETLVVEHTLSGNASRVDFRLGQGTGTKAAWRPKNCWGRITRGGAGRFPMQNLGRYTNVTRPRRAGPWWGWGVEYHPDTGKARRIVGGAEYANAHPGEDLTGTSGYANTTNNGVTSTILSRYIDAQGRVVARIQHQGTLTAISAGAGTANVASRTPAAPGQTWVSRLECRLISGSSPSEGVAPGVHEETAPGTYLVGNGSTDGGDTPIASEWTTRKTTRTLSNGSTDQVRLGAVLRGEVGEVIDCVIEYREVQIAPGDFPYLPRLPGGQSVHALQRRQVNAHRIMPLGPNLYPQGQSGAINNANLTAGPNLVVNGDGSDGTTGWTDGVNDSTITNNEGVLRVTKGSGDGFGARAYQSINGLTPGQAYVVYGQRVANSGATGRIHLTETYGTVGNALITFPDANVVFAPRVMVAADTNIDMALVVGNSPGDWAEFDNLAFYAYTGAWRSDNGGGRFSISGNMLTLVAGASEETVSLLAAVMALTNGSLARYDLTVACTAGSIVVRNAGGTVLHTIKAGETRTVNGQALVASGVTFSLYGGATAAGTITVHSVRRVGASSFTMFGDTLTQDFGSAAPYVMEFAADNNNRTILRYNNTSAMRGIVLRGGSTVGSNLVGDIQTSQVRTKSAVAARNNRLQVAYGGAASAGADPGEIPDAATLHFGNNNLGTVDLTGDAYAFAVFARDLTQAELEALTT